MNRLKSYRQYVTRSVSMGVLILTAVVLTAGWLQMSRNDGKVRVTIKENGATVTLHSGDILEVTLPATLGTGYSWKVANSAATVLKEQGSPEAGSAETAGKAGQPENQVFLFNTLAKGTGQLELQYLRPWEKDRKPAKTFSLTVKVE